jgi:hypothetical protein
MRNKLTGPAPMPDDLPLLSAREQVFVERLGQGDTNTDAYRAAYGAEGHGAPSLRVIACRKAAEPRIRQYLRTLMAAGFAKACQTREQRIEDEMAFAERCEAAGNYGAAGCARDRLNRLLGFYVEKSEIILKSSPEQTLQELAELIGEDSANIEVRH